MDPITKYILSEVGMETIDKDLDKNEKEIKQIPKDSSANLKQMKNTPVKEILHRYMFEYISKSDCPPDSTKDPKTGECSKNPHDEEVDDKESSMKVMGHANY